jgi:hypothetical protein
MKACQQPLVSQALHIPADGLQRHTKGICQLLDRDRALGPDGAKQDELSGVWIHRRFLSEMSDGMDFKANQKE